MAEDDVRSPTELLAAMRAGDSDAQEQLLQKMYPLLCGIAHNVRAKKDLRSSLQTTDLVHEGVLRIFDGEALKSAENRRHVYGIAAQAMRRILVEHARAKNARKRGGGAARVPLFDEMLAVFERERLDVLALDDALRELEKHDSRLHDAVNCHYFLGMTQPEIAAQWGMSLRTVEGDVKRAKEFLRRLLSG